MAYVSTKRDVIENWVNLKDLDFDFLLSVSLCFFVIFDNTLDLIEFDKKYIDVSLDNQIVYADIYVFYNLLLFTVSTLDRKWVVSVAKRFRI
jgi:hypothetical protein